MIKLSYILLFLFFEIFSFFLEDNERFYIKVVQCNVYIIDGAKSGNTAKGYIYLGRNYKDEEEQKQENHKELSYSSAMNDISDLEKESMEKNNSLRNIYNRKFLHIGDFFYAQCSKKYDFTKIIQFEYLCKKNDIYTKVKINGNYQMEKNHVEKLINNYGYFLFSNFDKKTENAEIGPIFSLSTNMSYICSSNESPVLHISTVCENKTNINDDNDKIHVNTFLNKDEDISLTCNKSSINILSAYYIKGNIYHNDDVLNTTDYISECCNGLNECNIPSFYFLNMIKHNKDGKTDIGYGPFLLIEYKCNSKNLKKNIKAEGENIYNLPILSGNKCSSGENKLKDMNNRIYKQNEVDNLQNIKNLLPYYMLLRKKNFNPFFFKLKEKIKMPYISKNTMNNLNVQNKKKEYFAIDNKKEKKMLNSLLLNSKQNIMLQNTYNIYTQNMGYQVFFNNSITKNKKDNFKIYKMENNNLNKFSKKATFLELTSEYISKIESSVAKDDTHYHVPFKNPYILKNHSEQYDLLDDENEWFPTPDLPISCRETGCPNPYEMCVPVYTDEKKFFGDKKWQDIIKEIVNKAIPGGNFTMDYNIPYEVHFVCVCKKQGSDNFCDESVE